MADIKLIYSNAKPEKPRKVRQLPKVSPYCPVCKSNVWIMVNVGMANIIQGIRPCKMRCCVACLSKGMLTTW